MSYFGPFKPIPCSDDKQATFDYMGPSEHTFSRCGLLNTVVKFPDNTNEMNKLNESCIDLKVSNGSLHFKASSHQFVPFCMCLRPRSHGTGSVWSPYQFEKSQDKHDS